MIIKIIFLFFFPPPSRSLPPFSHGSTLFRQYLLCQYLARLQPLSPQPLSDPYSALKPALTSETTSMFLPRARRYFWEITCQVELKWENKKKRKKNFCKAETWPRRSRGNSPRNEFLKREYEDIDVEHFAYDKLFFHKEKWLVLEWLENVAGEKSVPGSQILRAFRIH